MGYKILAINPGSTSTKVALYDEERPLLELNLRHSTEEISRFAGVNDQLDWRRGLILSALREEAFDIRNLSAVIGRGGLIRPIPAGVYEVNSRMRYDLRNAQMKHACNLGGLLAAQIAHMAGVKAYIADPPVVDEMDDAARISGMPMCPRKPVFHALNQKATARLHCERMGWVYEESNLIVAHMGGGISVAAHKQGRIVDVNNALDGDGPFAPDRAGSIPSSELIKVCFSGQYTKEELLKFISSKGGLVAYLGTNSVIQVMERIAQGGIGIMERSVIIFLSVERPCRQAADIARGKVEIVVHPSVHIHFRPVGHAGQVDLFHAGVVERVADRRGAGKGDPSGNPDLGKLARQFEFGDARVECGSDRGLYLIGGHPGHIDRAGYR